MRSYSSPETTVDFLLELASKIQEQVDRSSSTAIHLANGDLGASLLLANLYRLTGEPQLKQCANKIAERVIDMMTDSSSLVGFYEGITGAVWALEQIGDNLGVNYFDSDSRQDLDDYIIEQIGTDSSLPLDLMIGLTGLGLYAVERRESAAASVLTTAVWDRLIGEVNLHPVQGHFWPMRLRRIDSGRRYDQFDIGLAHGNPGVLSFLCRAISIGHIDNSELRHVWGMVKWLLRQHRPVAKSGWGYCSGDESTSRLAWCYGDLSILVALTQAAELLGDASLMEFCRTSVLRAFSRTDSEIGIVDASVCHGTAGLALLADFFLSRFPNEPILSEAKSEWLLKTLDRFDLTASASGYDFYNGQKREANHSFLNGSSGIGLTILSLTVPALSSWRSALLLFS